MDLRKLRVADYVIAAGTVLYLILAMFPWWDLGLFTLSGFEGSGSVSSAFVLFLLATAWGLLPAFTDLQLGFPRSWVTVGLAALGLLLTLVAWADTLDLGFSLWALLGLLTAAVILLSAVFTLLPDLRTGPHPGSPVPPVTTPIQMPPPQQPPPQQPPPQQPPPAGA